MVLRRRVVFDLRCADPRQRLVRMEPSSPDHARGVACTGVVGRAAHFAGRCLRRYVSAKEELVRFCGLVEGSERVVGGLSPVMAGHFKKVGATPWQTIKK